ncbi:hypothetical protein TNCV_3785121 [Trichonephila clavipes]|nr:hypothetical protein TNCV_3785121 [Trichonephila clavipes]
MNSKSTVPILMKIGMYMNFDTEKHLIPSATFRRFINSKASRRSCIIMPPKRRAIGRSTPQARKRRALRASESDEQRALRLENLRVHATETRSSESSDHRELRLETVIEYVLIRSVLL